MTVADYPHLQASDNCFRKRINIINSCLSVIKHVYVPKTLVVGTVARIICLLKNKDFFGSTERQFRYLKRQAGSWKEIDSTYSQRTLPKHFSYVYYLFWPDS